MTQATARTAIKLRQANMWQPLYSAFIIIGLKRVAIFQIRFPRLVFDFAHAVVAKPLHTFVRHALVPRFCYIRLTRLLSDITAKLILPLWQM
ncbi:hypothetical protein [Rhizobium sp. JAB6]|uniref:hypothetical protein n=1 Tax=Rhizobium sp. JAB6 TaxID=2127050 RepID=UPI001FDEFA23|nr:hypothetical protein [Rhizobium sp. JAB6]